MSNFNMLIRNCVNTKNLLLLNFYLVSGNAAARFRECVTNIKREKHSAFHPQIWLPRSRHHGLRDRQEPSQFRPLGDRMEQNARQGKTLLSLTGIIGSDALQWLWCVICTV